MTEVWPFLKKAFDISDGLPVNLIYIDDYPMCMTKGYEKFNADSFADGVHDDDSEHFNADFIGGNLIHENQKIFTKKCNDCEHRKKCQGIWKEYVKHFSDKEFGNVK